MVKIASERFKGKSGKVQGKKFAEENFGKRGREGPHVKLTCMWEDGVYLGVKATGQNMTENRSGVWPTRRFRENDGDGETVRTEEDTPATSSRQQQW